MFRWGSLHISYTTSVYGGKGRHETEDDDKQGMR
jgi:hypothetical protein